MREGRPRFLWGGSSPVWCRYSHATFTSRGVTHHTSPPLVHLINREPSLSPGRGKEESDGVSAPPQLHSLAPCSADCSVLHLCACAASSCAAAAHAAPPSRLTHRQFGQSSSSGGGRGGRVCNQWWCNSRKATQVELLQQLLVVMVQLQQTDTADCRLQSGSCSMLVPAAMQPALAVPPAMGALACPGTFQ